LVAVTASFVRVNVMVSVIVLVAVAVFVVLFVGLFIIILASIGAWAHVVMAEAMDAKARVETDDVTETMKGQTGQ
jgi:uncharacterized membrane protein